MGHDCLTKMELIVLQQLVYGISNKAIAKRLYISEKTVKNHLSCIYKKLGVQNRTTAAIKSVILSFVENPLLLDIDLQATFPLVFEHQKKDLSAKDRTICTSNVNHLRYKLSRKNSLSVVKCLFNVDLDTAIGG